MSGLEVVGSIASVIQLAGAVYAISKTLYEVGDALSNAPSDIKDLARDLETFSEELHLLSSLLDGKHRYSDRVYSLTAKILGDCAAICVKIDRLLKKLRSGSEKQDQEPITVPSTSITPIDDTKELWWRAYGELKITSPRAGLEIAKAWNKVSRSMLVGSSAAKLAETNVGLALIHLDWIYNHFCVRSSNTGKLYTAMPRLERISRGTENTLKYKFGALAWVCLSSAIQIGGLERYGEYISAFTDAAMLIARYNVLESIYQQWSGMSLDEEYESSIIALCKLILQYLAEVLDLGASGQSGPNSFQDQSENNSDMDGIVNKSTKRSFESCSDDIAEATGDQAPVLSHSTSFPRTPKSPFFKRVRTSESPTKSHNRGC